jgi:hypothetical protein
MEFLLELKELVESRLSDHLPEEVLLIHMVPVVLLDPLLLLLLDLKLELFLLVQDK